MVARFMAVGVSIVLAAEVVGCAAEATVPDELPTVDAPPRGKGSGGESTDDLLAAPSGGKSTPTSDDSNEANGTPSGPVGAPTLVAPIAGSKMGLAGAYTFKVKPTARSSGTQCGLWQDGKLVWENLRDDGALGTAGECAISPNQPKHRTFHSGKVRFVARDRVGDRWSDELAAEIQLVAEAPTAISPVNGQLVTRGGSYIFKVGGSIGTEGVLCAISQNNTIVWENLANDKVLGMNGECGLHPGHPRHAAVQLGAAKFIARHRVHGEWSEALVVNLTLK